MKATPTILLVAIFLLGAPMRLGAVAGQGTCAGDACPPPFTIGDLPFDDVGDTCALTSSVQTYSQECPIGGDDYSGPDAVYEIELTEGNRDVEFFVPHVTGDFVLVLLEDCGPGARCVVSSPDLDGVRQERIPPASYAPGTYYVYVDSAADAEPGCGRFELLVRGVNPPEPDLALQVAGADGPAAVAGAGFTYNLMVINDSPFSASNATVRAVLPAGVTFLSASPGCARQAPRQVVCEVGEVPRDTIRTQRITVRTAPSRRTPIALQASVEGVETDPEPANDETSFSAQVVARADLAVELTAPVSAVAGRSVPYTLAVANNGPSTATGVRVTTSLPVGAILEGVPAACEAVGERRLVCEVGPLAPGQTLQGTISARLDTAFRGDLLGTAIVSNRATTAAREIDPDLASNRSDARTEVVGEASLSLSKAAAPGAVEVTQGQTSLLLYQLTVTNDGPSDATSVTVTDAFDGGLPDGVVFRSSVGCENDPGGFPACRLGTVPVGSSKEFVLAFAVGEVAEGSLTNTAAAESAEVSPEATASSTVDVSVVDPPPELSVEVQVDGGFFAIIGKGSFFPSPDYQISVQGSPDMAQLVVDTRPSRGLAFASTTFCAEDPVGFPRCRIFPTTPPGFFTATLSFVTLPEATEPFVTEFRLTALDGQGRPITDALVRCTGSDCQEVDKVAVTVDEGTSLAVPRFDVDPDVGATTLFAVRNGSEQPVIARFEYRDDEGIRAIRPAEARPLLSRQQRTVDLREVVDGPASGSIRITAYDPETGRVLADHPLYGEFLRIDPETASGGLLPDLSNPVVAECTRWNVGFVHDDVFDEGTDFDVLVPDNPGSVLEGTIYDADGAPRSIRLETSLDSFERPARTTQGLFGVPGSIDWVLGVPGVVSATHRGQGLAMGSPGVCLSPVEAASRLLVPFFELDRDAGKTTRFSLRNTGAEPVEVQIRFFEAFGQPLGEDVIVLSGHAVHEVDLESHPALGNFNSVTGFVRIDQVEGEGGVLAGEYRLLDLESETAAGGALVDADRSPEPSGLCRRWDQRFVQGDGVETEILVYLEEAFEASVPGNAPALVGLLFDEEGEPRTGGFTRTVGSRVFTLTPPDGTGAVEWRFRNDRIGHVAGIVRSGDSAVLVPAVCRDPGPPD